MQSANILLEHKLSDEAGQNHPISFYLKQMIDVSDTPEAKDAGFKVPVCITVGAHALIQVPELLSGWQDYSGRLWDTLFLAAAAFKLAGETFVIF